MGRTYSVDEAFLILQHNKITSHKRYYLQYKNNRGQYVDNWWNAVDWNAVDNRFREAEKLRWRPF